MILTCPACDTKYVVKDGAIPAGGRQVRCASCKHSWHQDPEVTDDDGEQSLAEAALIEPRSGPEAEERAYQEAMIGDERGAVTDDLDVAAAPAETVGDSEPAAPPERDDWQDAAVDSKVTEPHSDAAEWTGGRGEGETSEFEPFYEPEPVDAPRRRVPWLLVVLLLVAAAAAAGWYLAPESVRARLGLTGDGATPLEVMVTNSDRQQLASGNELFAVSGRVINPTDQAQPVPQLRAELLDATRKRVVYSWIIDAPAATLGPGDSASFNSAEVDVPQGGSHLRVTLAGPPA